MPIKNAYKAECYKIAKEMSVTLPAIPVALDLLFWPPANRGDLDGYLSSVKYGLDSVAEALGIDDKYFRPIKIDVGGIDKINPRVEITIKTQGE